MQNNCSFCLWYNNIYNFKSYQAIKYVLRIQTKKIVGKGGKMALLVKKVADPWPNWRTPVHCCCSVCQTHWHRWATRGRHSKTHGSHEGHLTQHQWSQTYLYKELPYRWVGGSGRYTVLSPAWPLREYCCSPVLSQWAELHLQKKMAII